MPKLEKILGRKVLDSRGEWTIEVEAQSENQKAIFMVPQGKSRGQFEAVSLEPEIAIKNVKEIIEPQLKDFEIEDQKGLDKKLLELDGTKDKSKLGANAILGISGATAKLAAQIQGAPLYRYLRKAFLPQKTDFPMPALLMNMINGGAHAENNLDFQEYLVIFEKGSIKSKLELASKFYLALKEKLKKEFGQEAVGLGDEGGFVGKDFSSNDQPLKILTELIQSSGLSGQVKLGIDAAASQFFQNGEYQLENKKINKTELLEVYKNLFKNFSLFYLLEDPFEENDFESFKLLKNSCLDKLIVGDDLTTTNPERIIEAKKQESINGLIVKPNQIGTLTEVFKAAELAEQYGWKMIVGHRSGETEDPFISHLAVALGAWGLKAGAPARGERTTKYNELLRISEDISQK